MSFIPRTADRPAKVRHTTAVVAPEPGAPAVVSLDDPMALAPHVTGAKAAALAAAARSGLPVLPGSVLTTALPATAEEREAALDSAWSRISEGGRRSVVVRSSSTIEDDNDSSMAGMFTSVLNVGTRRHFGEAVAAVLQSGELVGAGHFASTEAPGAAPMAVLVQPYLAALAGGVLFGVDPVSGRRDRLVVASSTLGPAAVVSGSVEGTRYVLSRRGRALSREGAGAGEAGLSRRQLRALARLARRAEGSFGGPQDIEWAFDADGRLRLLQSRPITAVGDSARATGPLLGPGPVAETFPHPLSVLEEDLWVQPLRDALRHALVLAGTVPRRRLAASPVVVSVDGRLAADLDALGIKSATPSVLGRLDPRPPIRKLVAAWRVGRLKAALPGLASDLISRADTEMLSVPRLDQLSDGQLLRLLGRSGQALAALHGHEVLMGWLVNPGAPSVTGASVAMRTLAGARQQGMSDAEIVARHPVVLALLPPRIAGDPIALPTTDGDLPPAPPAGGDPSAMLREALRLRARWVHELTAAAARELGGRLVARGVLADPEHITQLRIDELRAAVRSGVTPDGIEARRRESVPPLPAQFRLTPDGAVVAVAESHSSGHRGVGAGGGRGSGPAHSGAGEPPAGAVLVVRALEPGLAPLLPRLAGLVAETGSPLSHLAILAREFGVATAVSVPDALTRFPAGSAVVVDGTTGEVALSAETGGGA